MTEKELIYKLQSLKQIKPRENWVVFNKSNIFNNSVEVIKVARTNYADVLTNIFKMNFSRKFTYSVAVLLFVMSVGTAFVMNGDFLNNSNVSVSKNSSASLIAIKDSVEQLKEKSKSLSGTVKSNPEGTSIVIKEIKDVARDLAMAIQKNPRLAKEVALDVNNNKTYLEVSDASDLKEASSNLYKIIVEQMIKDLKNTMLTDSQKESLKIVENSYNDGKYTSALESILLLSNSINQIN